MPQTYNLDPCTVSESLGLLDRLLLAEILPNGKITPIMSCSGSYQEKQFPKDLKITEASWSISQVSVFSLFHHDSVERFTFRSTSCQSPDTHNKKCKSSPGYNIRQSRFQMFTVFGKRSNIEAHVTSPTGIKLLFFFAITATAVRQSITLLSFKKPVTKTEREKSFAQRQSNSLILKLE